MTIRIFQNAWFQRFARRQGIQKSVLIDAVARAERGLIDANLGGGLLKQRIARSGQGKSGGYRTIIVFRKNSRAFFVYGFAKSSRDNLTKDEFEAFKKAAQELLALSDEQIETLIATGGLMEIEP